MKSLNAFKLVSEYSPAGDQPEAIKKLMAGLSSSMHKQTLLGATGTGKTFTMANIIAGVGKPTLVIAHNKTLAAQLAQEFKEFFPENAVHYFVSYYDYYQPEAYMPITDTYIEKDAAINEEIDRLRHASTQSLLTRKDVIIVASVSCIYGLGSPADYEREHLLVNTGDKFERNDFLRRLVDIHFERTNADLTPGQFRSVGSSVEVMPTNEKTVYIFDIDEGLVQKIIEVDPVTREQKAVLENIFIYPAKHFITNEADRKRAMVAIGKEMNERVEKFKAAGKFLEAERIERRTLNDLAMIEQVGYCSGIENYSRHLSGRPAGEAPDTLLAYFPKTKDGSPDFLTIIDESHVTLPQLSGMWGGDKSRKETLVEYGFRLPSAMDNRPLRYEEFEERTGQVIYTSATPGADERSQSAQVVEQIIRPTGLLDPAVEVRPIRAETDYPGQVGDVMKEIEKTVKKGDRVLVTTLTKKMAEELASFLKDKGIKAEYLHSDIKTIERITLISKFRRGEFECLVGVNLLREGLDLPEVSFIAILDADKEGFLRSETSLVQTIGRAARNENGWVVLYADNVTGSMKRAMEETKRRRETQAAYNKANGITPKTIKKAIKDIAEELEKARLKVAGAEIALEKELGVKDIGKLLKQKEKQMNAAAKILDFETAAILRDEILLLKERQSEGR